MIPPSHKSSLLEILICTSFAKDGELTASVLNKAGFVTRVLSGQPNFESLVQEAGLVLLSEERLSPETLQNLRVAVEKQPPWFDIPIIVVSGGESTKVSTQGRLEKITSFLQNVTLLERPVRLATLVSVVKSALSSRQKQFELRRTLADLENARLNSEAANLAKSSFLANMSHEIRTPLAAIIGFTNLMRDINLPAAERLQFAEIVARNGDQLATLINDILDLSKIEAGKYDIENLPLNYATFISELDTFLRPLIEQRGLRFDFVRVGPSPARVIADGNRIRQVLVNLISNSAKFTEKGYVRLEVRTRALEGNNVVLEFDVIDTGIGMNNEQSAKLFEPFSQADVSVTRRYGGTGLGLALSKRLAHAMKGKLELIKSGLGEGSHFRAQFVTEILKDESSAMAESNSALILATASAASVSLEGLKILLAEDAPDNQVLMNRYLSKAKAVVTTVENGQLAKEHALQGDFDLVLMDVQMPIMDGLTATRELRKLGYQKPIIALTAHAMKEERDRSFAAGCNDHLSKPIDRALLLSTLAQYRSERV